MGSITKIHRHNLQLQHQIIWVCYQFYIGLSGFVVNSKAPRFTRVNLFIDFHQLSEADMSTSHSNLDSSPSLDGMADVGGRICDNETSFTNPGRWSRPGCSRPSGYSSIPVDGYTTIPDVTMSRGGYTSVPVSQVSSNSSSPPQHQPPAGQGRQDHDCVRESKSTEPLLSPEPPMDTESQGAPPPPRAYTDSVTLDPGQLGGAMATSYVNVGVNDHKHHADVFTLHNRRQEPAPRRQDAPGTEISV